MHLFFPLDDFEHCTDDVFDTVLWCFVFRRNTPENSEVEIEKLLDDVLFYFPLLKKTRGKKVFELRINVDWDKGRAVEWLLHSMDVDPYNPQV